MKKTPDRFGRIDVLVNIAGAVPGLDVVQMIDLAVKSQGGAAGQGSCES